MSKTDECKVCGEPLIPIKKAQMSYWRHLRIPSGFDLHKPWAAKEFEDNEKKGITRFCYDKHPIFMMIFCRRAPNHEGKHRSYGGIEWSQMVSEDARSVEAPK